MWRDLALAFSLPFILCAYGILGRTVLQHAVTRHATLLLGKAVSCIIVGAICIPLSYVGLFPPPELPLIEVTLSFEVYIGLLLLGIGFVDCLFLVKHYPVNGALSAPEVA